jgi:putative spermidine/putrescine transport system substrate-binding protein
LGNKKIGVWVMVFALAAFVLSGCSGGTKATGKSKELVVMSWGGDLEKAQREAWFKPFEKKYNVKIKEIQIVDYAKLKQQVQQKNVQVDVVDSDWDFVPRGAAQGLLEPLDYKVIDKTGLDKRFVSKYAVPSEISTINISYNTNKFSKTNHPDTWKDFWNVKKYPGKRAMYKYPLGTLEMALLADGVKKQDLYPLDVERALKSLDKIKSHIIWWDTGAQSVQLLQNGDAPLGAVWSGRVKAGQKQGMPLAFEKNEAVLNVDTWIVPKGAPNRELAMKFINFVTQPKVMADFAKIYPYAVGNTKAYKYLSEKEKANLVTTPEDINKQLLFNVKWWEKNYDKVNQRFIEWLNE